MARAARRRVLRGSRPQPDGDRAWYGYRSLYVTRWYSMNRGGLPRIIIGLGCSSQCGFLKGFDILQPVAHLVAKLEEQRPSRFSPPAFKRRLADSPALGQLGLCHASFGHHGSPLTGVLGTTMKALFAGKAKWADSPGPKSELNDASVGWW